MPTALIAILAIAAGIAAWLAENAAIHAVGYSGFAGAGWITAIIIPIGAACWVWDALSPAAKQR
jgi:hypothetical protein